MSDPLPTLRPHQKANRPTLAPDHRITSDHAVDGMGSTRFEDFAVQIRKSFVASRPFVAGHPVIQNRGALRDFYKALYTYGAAPTTTRFAIAYYGDSVAQHVPGELSKLTTQSIPRADLSGPGVLQSGLTRSIATGMTYDGLNAVVDPAQLVMNGTGGFADFTYLPSADHITLGNAGVLEWDSGAGGTSYGEARIYLASGPGFGSAFVEIINRDTAAVVASATQALSAGSLGAVKVTFPGLARGGKYKVRITATGVVVHLKTILLRPSGVVNVHCNIGGSSLTQNNYSNADIFAFITSDLGCALISLQCKEEGLPGGSLAPTIARLALVTGASKFIIGSLPDGTDEAGQIERNAQFEEAAFNADYAYFDGRAAFGATGAYAELVRLGWINHPADQTHALEPANRFVAGLIYAQLFANRWPGTHVKESVDHGDQPAGSYVATPSFRVFGGDLSGATVEVITNAGGGSPTKANLRNINRVFFDQSGATAANLAAFDAAHCTVYNTAGTIGGMRLLNLTLTATTSTSISTPGGITATGDVIIGGSVRTAVKTVATLPAAPVAGQTSVVSDALTPTYGATVVGGGSVVTPVFYNGTNWTCR
jgi:hypothetical protein